MHPWDGAIVGWPITLEIKERRAVGSYGGLDAESNLLNEGGSQGAVMRGMTSQWLLGVV